MLPITVDYAPAADVAPSPDLLAVIEFDGGARAASPSLLLSIPQLGTPPLAEVWRSRLPVERGNDGAMAYASNGELLFGTIEDGDDDLEAAATRAYGAIADTIRRLGYPNLLRVWNHVRDINGGDDARYQSFCAGRHDALTAAGIHPCQFPAASAVGMRAAGIAIHFVASRSPGLQIENPRQLRAYQYPPQYGRRSPSFARATLARFGSSSLLLVSGTSSVVGHQTMHAGDIAAQTDETITNLDLIARATGDATGSRADISDFRLLKVYLRRAEDQQTVEARLRDAAPEAKMLILQSDICRADLLVEVEAILGVGGGV